MPGKPGRPKKGTPPAFVREELDKLLVHGEVVVRPDGKGTTVHYPTYRELAKKYDVAHSLIAQYSLEHNCMKRRKQAQKRVEQMADVKLAELRSDRLALTKDDILRIIDRYLAKFEEALAEGRVRCDNPADYNTMVRLRSFIVGDADSRPEVVGGITLEEIQRRHAAQLKLIENTTPGERGEVTVH